MAIGPVVVAEDTVDDAIRGWHYTESLHVRDMGDYVCVYARYEGRGPHAGAGRHVHIRRWADRAKIADAFLGISEPPGTADHQPRHARRAS